MSRICLDSLPPFPSQKLKMGRGISVLNSSPVFTYISIQEVELLYKKDATLFLLLFKGENILNNLCDRGCGKNYHNLQLIKEIILFSSKFVPIFSSKSLLNHH